MSEKTPVELWVEALRSGEFKQARGVLHRKGHGNQPDRFCCLGVACEVYRREVGDLRVGEDNDVKGRVLVTYERNDASLPGLVMDWLGLRDETGAWRGRDDKDECLASKNDNGASFKQIADLIESRPPGLFKDEA